MRGVFMLKGRLHGFVTFGIGNVTNPLCTKSPEKSTGNSNPVMTLSAGDARVV